MKPSKRPTFGKSATCLAVAVLFLLAATPVLATEADVKEKTLTAKGKPIEAVDADSQDRPNTGICIDADSGESIEVNTLEDIFAISAGNLAALMEQAPEKAAEPKPQAEEVRWQKLETGAKKGEPERKSKGD